MFQKFYISERFFTAEELEFFKEKFKYSVSEVSYSAAEEIDFSSKEEKDFLFKEGFPKILARFFAF